MVYKVKLTGRGEIVEPNQGKKRKRTGEREKDPLIALLLYCGRKRDEIDISALEKIREIKNERS